MKIIYIGSSTNSLSLIPFQALIKSKFQISALAFDDDQSSDFNVTITRSIQSLALNNKIPLIRLTKDYTNALSQIRSFEPDIILVSCYARRIPLPILSIANKGCFNIHPSLLPAFRGPNPLFWQFRDGIEKFGITLHRMTSEFDDGDIISQKTIFIDDGCHSSEVTELLADAASSLIFNMVTDIIDDTLTESQQDNELSSYQSFPSKNDYIVNTMWTAKRMYNFINAYKGEGVSFLCDIKNKKFHLIDAYSYQVKPYSNMNNKTVFMEGDLITFECANSYIQCKFKINE